MHLEKAKITELDGKTERSFDVQFNPTSLRLSLSKKVAGADSTGAPVAQQTGAGSTTLAIDELIFDTADLGTTGNPVSVRDQTKKLERFVAPKDTGKDPDAAPNIGFTWGDLHIIGVVNSLTIDFDHFAANGTPLRAKVSLSIREQDIDKQLKAKKDKRAGAPGPGHALAGGVGFSASASFGLGASASVGVALEGESSAEFAARVGVDPAAWRGLQIGGESSISLSAGVEVGFDANLNASAGLGVTPGIAAGASASLEASFGLEANASMNAVAGVGAGAELASGIALSSAGGVAAAMESVQSVKNQLAEQQARAAFQAPAKALPTASAPTTQATIPSPNAAGPIAARPKPPEQPRTPLNATGLPSLSAQQAAPAAPGRPRADARASSFGFGVPLRTTVGEAADLRAGSMQGDVVVKPRIASGEPPSTNDPTTPAWVALPARDRARNAADKIQGQLRPTRPCGCAGRCKLLMSGGQVARSCHGRSR
ncbi:MAG: hypothetical protein AABN34_02275 [Acidobacteriota bacterium]